MSGAPVGYVEVKDRLIQAREQYPDHRFQSDYFTEHLQAGEFVVVVTRFYRTPDDPTPAVGMAWEPVPGKTNFTRDSELMNAETSAWGRALIAAGVADAHEGVASANEVRNRQYESKSNEPAIGIYQCPVCGSQVYDNREKNKNNNYPLWACSNKKCEGGSKRKQGTGNYPWGSYESDPGDAGLIGPPPVRDDYEAPEVPLPELREDFGPDEAPF
jgi:hypothetical protein